ncbi:MAG TPA: hypothetical protein VH000_02355 [Rhizomicrobium sp.]|nr:hypothetical protein [Rhizomicrobium sp.]
MNTTTAQPEPAKAKGGFPPFDQTTFPSQIFWLAVTFAFLFVVLWRVAGPRISGAISARRDKINGDLSSAEQSRKAAEAASDAYDGALSVARARANKMAEENRKVISDEIERAKAKADSEAHAAMAAADTRILASRDQAKGHMIAAAQDAATEIVRRLTGESVASDDVAAAVRTATGS